MMSAFTIGEQSGLATERPDNSTKEERHSSIMRVPGHKQGTVKFDGHFSNRTIAPLTLEEIP